MDQPVLGVSAAPTPTTRSRPCWATRRSAPHRRASGDRAASPALRARGQTGSTRGSWPRSRRAVSRRCTRTRRRRSSRSAPGATSCVVTPTASGKTLCYNLPVLDAVARDEAARALYLFPTKALAADQLVELRALADAAEIGLKTHTYDGDTPPNIRSVVRAAGQVVITNPDMLHAAILPHHTKWFKLFENLQFVVIDELHTYRGLFGSHVANVIRRLRRICRHYGADPIFICASATIANPGELAERLLEAPVDAGRRQRRALAGASTSWSSTRRSPTRSSASAARPCSPGSASRSG